ncbi:hypothetical protein BDY21DRAFT_354364 [Lineolata rhizophorae]|uniref:Uncharacterized protein n=1 Tax=Lineolata rhizophorae TaxID=578093 RepID=A0A6A6NR20_9PEZI|nr:hypothetical protein BDY21DRAFT_354364 [Lineolata rhizophorae]
MEADLTGEPARRVLWARDASLRAETETDAGVPPGAAPGVRTGRSNLGGGGRKPFFAGVRRSEAGPILPVVMAGWCSAAAALECVVEEWWRWDGPGRRAERKDVNGAAGPRAGDMVEAKRAFLRGEAKRSDVEGLKGAVTPLLLLPLWWLL